MTQRVASTAAARPKLKPRQLQLIASGDLRESANQVCWPAQEAMERALGMAVGQDGYEVVRAHRFDLRRGHGFIGSQREGMTVFKGVDPQAPLIVAEAVWQYSHHVLHGLMSHRGPILRMGKGSSAAQNNTVRPVHRFP